MQLAPAANAVLTAHVPLRLKSAGLAPPGVNEATVSVPLPELVSVTPFVLLILLPTCTLPKLSCDALNVAAGEVTAPAACVARSVLPPTVKLALRVAPVLEAAAKDIVALPVPLAADVTVSHDALLATLHAQPAPAVSVVVPPPPVAAKLALDGLKVNVHPAAA